MGEGIKTRRNKSKGSLLKYLYNLGDENNALTGGWKAVATRDNRYTSTPTAPILTKNTDNMSYSLSSTSDVKQGCVATTNAIDLTSYKKLTILHKGSLTAYNSDGIISLFCATVSGPNFTAVAEKTLVYSNVVSAYTQYEIDITSLNGAYSILVALQSSQSRTATGSFTKIWLE